MFSQLVICLLNLLRILLLWDLGSVCGIFCLFFYFFNFYLLIHLLFRATPEAYGGC